MTVKYSLLTFFYRSQVQVTVVVYITNRVGWSRAELAFPVWSVVLGDRVQLVYMCSDL